MKRILFLMISSVLLFAQCEHPYEQDLIGAFPFAELMDSDPDTFGSDASQYEMRVSTNMVITTRINYIEGGGSNDWIDIETTEEKGGIRKEYFLNLYNILDSPLKFDKTPQERYELDMFYREKYRKLYEQEEKNIK